MPSDTGEAQPIAAPGRRRLELSAPGAVIGSLASVGAGQIALLVTGIAAARTLGPTDRGYLALVVVVPLVLHAVGSLGVPRAVTYFIASGPARERAVLRAIRGPALLQAIVLTAIQLAVFAVLFADEPADVRWAALAALPLLAASLTDQYSRAILQGQHRYAALNVMRNAGLVLYLVGVVLLIATGDTELVDFTIAYVAASVVGALSTLAVALVRTKRDAGSDPVSRFDLVRFGLRGYLASLAPIGTFRLDQLVVGLLLSPAALGLYVVALALTNVPMLIAQSIGLVAYPQVASARDARDEARRYLWVSVALSGAALVMLELAAGMLVPFFFGDEFEAAVPLTRVLLVAAFLDGVRRVLTDTSAGRGRPGLGSVAEVTSWLVLVPALVILLPVWEELGVAVATAVAAAAALVVLGVLLRRDEKIRPG